MPISILFFLSLPERELYDYLLRRSSSVSSSSSGSERFRYNFETMDRIRIGFRVLESVKSTVEILISAELFGFVWAATRNFLEVVAVFYIGYDRHLSLHIHFCCIDICMEQRRQRKAVKRQNISGLIKLDIKHLGISC